MIRNLTTHRYSASRRLRKPPLVDVYLPDHPRPLPPALVVHGGGFVVGSRKMSAARHLAETLHDAGYAVASVDYRLVFRGGRIDEGIEDVTAAMRWWRAQAADFGLDTDQMIVAGLSAGAALMTMSLPELGPVRAAIGVYGVYDFTRLLGHRTGLPARVLLRTANREVWQARSPARTCDVDVPMLLVHGTADRLVPYEHTESLAAFRRARGLPVEVRLYEGEPHSFLRHPELPVYQQTMRDILDFLATTTR